MKVRLDEVTSKEAATAVELSDCVSEGLQLKRMLHQLRDKLSTVDLPFVSSNLVFEFFFNLFKLTRVTGRDLGSYADPRVKHGARKRSHGQQKSIRDYQRKYAKQDSSARCTRKIQNGLWKRAPMRDFSRF